MTTALKGAALVPGAVAFIRTDTHFYGPDGRHYIGAFGPVNVVRAEDVLGFKPKNSADWFIQVGSGENSVLIAGCQIHYAGIFTRCPEGSEFYDATKWCASEPEELAA